MDPTTELVARNIRKHMDDQHRTIHQLADTLRVGPVTACRITHGDQPMDLGQLHTVAVWLGIPADSLARQEVAA